MSGVFNWIAKTLIETQIDRRKQKVTGNREVRRATVLLVAATRRNRRRRINREAPILTWRISQRTKNYENQREIS